MKAKNTVPEIMRERTGTFHDTHFMLQLLSLGQVWDDYSRYDSQKSAVEMAERLAKSNYGRTFRVLEVKSVSTRTLMNYFVPVKEKP